jgi:metallo-beta-lactamase family protein
MRLTCHGAARTVTGSQHLVEAGDSRVLLDCGLFQGGRTEMEEKNRSFPFDPARLDAVILSHAHLDHCGNLPNLAARGFRGRIHATAATADLARWILLDSAKIQEQDATYRAEKAAKRGIAALPPLYTQADVEAMLSLFQPEPMGRPFMPAPGVTATFQPAGHLLGATITTLDLEEEGRRARLTFSGDLGRFDVPLLADPVIPERPDYLLLESTYGDRSHEPVDAAYDRLGDIARDCIRQRGKLVIPTFALGRAQDLVFALHRMMDDGSLPRVGVYVDSPLAVRITRVYQAHLAAFDDETRAFTRADRHPDPFTFPEVHYVEPVEDSKALNSMPGPLIVLSSAGMATAGRILHHLKGTIGDPRNTVVIVSWQAPGTLGRRLVERESEVRIFGDWYPLRARVEVINGLSAHADREGLLAFARQTAATKRTILVHGEERPALALGDQLASGAPTTGDRATGGLPGVTVPYPHESFSL